MEKLAMIFLLPALCLLPIGCSQPTDGDHAGNSTQTGNAMIVGKLYNRNHTPAANATVHLRKKSTLADTSGAGLHKVLADTTATVTTNDTGGFAIDSINPGLYVIEGAKDSDVVLIDSVVVQDPDSTVHLPPDTLKPAGALKGIIYLSEGGDPRKVFILAFGIDRFAGVNLNGGFKFSNLAEGRYDLRIISSLDNYGVMDTFGISINSADTTNLDTIKLPFTGIPTPKNLSTTYDTLGQIVTLTWAKADTALIKGYNVYRRNLDSNTVLTRINTNPISDTLYRDSTGVQDMTYEYKVVAVSPNDMEGMKSLADTATVVSAFYLADSIGVKGTGFQQVNMPRCAISNDTYYIFFDLVDSSGFSSIKAKLFDVSGIFIRSFIIRQAFGKPQIAALMINPDTMCITFVDTTYVYDINGNLVNKYPLEFNDFSWDQAFLRNKDSLMVYSMDRSASQILVRKLGGDTISNLSIPLIPLREYVMRIDSSGNIFIGDKQEMIISKYDPNGNLVLSWGSKGTARSQFGYIADMAIDAENRTYVNDKENGRIIIFDSNGTFIGVFRTFLNPEGPYYDTSNPFTLFQKSNGDLCILEGNINSKIYIYKKRASIQLP